MLRRLIRRAIRSMRLLGVQDPTLPVLLPVSKEQMAKSYPELDRGGAGSPRSRMPRRTPSGAP